MADLVALTGGTGFLGRAIARHLVARGWRLRGLRRPAATDLPAGVEAIPGSLEDPDSLRRLVQGAAAVVHCAGAVRGAGPAAFDAVNRDGVARLARAAAEAVPPVRVLHISSLAARHPHLSPYAASKRAGERALAAAGVEAVVLRPPAVYGPGDRELRPLLAWMARGLALLLGPRAARFSLLHVDDLAAAVARLLEAPGAAEGTFELHDGRVGGYTWDDICDAVARWRGRPVRRIPVPGPVLAAVARLNLLVARAAGRPPMLTPGKVRELRCPDWVADNTALTAATGWVPAVDLAEGLGRQLARPA